jgi:hypothetical protein
MKRLPQADAAKALAWLDERTADGGFASWT